MACIKYLQDQLSVVPGRTWDAKIDGYKYKKLPIYSLGGKSLYLLWSNYSLLYAKKDRIRRTNFLAVGRLLCSKGEMKTGLSSYFVRLREFCCVYLNSMD